MQADLDVQSIPIADVFIVGKRRSVDEATVDQLVESIDKIGLQQAITVRVSDVNDPEEGEILGAFALVAGAHRLAACKRLGWKTVPAVVTRWDEVSAEQWEISENLHRNDLSGAERQILTGRWIELERVKKEQGFSPKGEKPRAGRPGLLSEAARSLGISNSTADRAHTVATKLTDDAKNAVIDEKLTAKQAEAVARAPAHQQMEKVAEIVAKREQKTATRSKQNSIDADVKDRAAQFVAEWIVEHAGQANISPVKEALYDAGAKNIATALANLAGTAIMDARFK